MSLPRSPRFSLLFITVIAQAPVASAATLGLPREIQPIPEPSSWLVGVFSVGLIVFGFVRRLPRR